MKLHLPKRLFTAVLLCISVCTAGAYATTLDNATLSIASFTQENLDTLTGAGWTLTGFDGNIQDGVFTSTTSAATIAGPSDVSLTTAAAGSRHVWSAIVTIRVDSLKDNSTILLKGSSGGVGLGASNSLVTGTWEANSNYGDSLPNIYNNGDGTITLGIVYLGNSGTTVYVGNSSLNVSSLRGSQDVPSITLSQIEGIEYTNLYWFNNTVSDDDMFSMLSDFDAHRELTWNGTNDSNIWNTDSMNWKKGETAVAFGSKDNNNVTFSDASDVSKTVNVSRSSTVGTMTVQDDYTFNMQDGATITTGSIILATDKTLSLNGNGAICVSDFTIDGTGSIDMAEDTRMEFSGLTVNSDFAFNMSGNASVSAETITLKSGVTATIDHIVLRENMTLTTNANAKLSVRNFTLDSEIATNQTLSLTGSGTLTINGESAFNDLCLVGTGLEVNADTTMTRLSTRSGSASSSITVAEGATLTMGEFACSWGINTLTVDGTLNADTSFTISSSNSGNNIINGTGTINAGKLAVKNYTQRNEFTGGITLNLGSDGIDNASSATIRFGNMTLGVTENATGWVTNVNTIELTDAENGAKFAPSEGKTITISGNMSGEGKLVKSGEGTLTLSGANTYEGGTTVESGTLAANSSGALGTSGAVTVSDGTLQIGAAVDLGARLTQTGGIISVTSDGSLTLGSAAISSAIQNSGSVTFTADITATGLVSTGDISQLADNENGFRSYLDSLTVVEGAGSITADGIHVTQGGKTYDLGTNGVATRTTCDYSVYFLRQGDGSVSTYAGMAQENGGTLTTVEMTSSGTLTVDADLATLNANTEGGTVAITTGTVQSLNVNANTTVSGLADPTVVELAGGATSTLTDGMSASGITFGGDNTGAAITNTGDSSQTYSLENATAKVTADKLTADSAEAVTIGNQLTVNNIINNGSGTLTVTGTVDSAALSSIEANEGDVVLMNATATLELAGLVIQSGKNVAVYTGELVAADAEGVLKVTGGSLTIGTEGSTLSANLVIGANTTLNFADGTALILGSDLTVENNVTLGSDLLAKLNALETGESLNLVMAKNGTTLGYTGAYDGMAAGSYFNTEGWDSGFDYTIVATGDTFSIRKDVAIVPEPATATLSLLALAALAARRRRKG